MDTLKQLYNLPLDNAEEPIKGGDDKPTLMQSLKNFYNNNKILCICLGALFLVLIVAIIILSIVLSKKSSNEKFQQNGDINLEEFNQSNETIDDRTNYATKWIESVIGTTVA